jgi:hypothetical protein
MMSRWEEMGRQYAPWLPQIRAARTRGALWPPNALHTALYTALYTHKL